MNVRWLIGVAMWLGSEARAQPTPPTAVVPPPTNAPPPITPPTAPPAPVARVTVPPPVPLLAPATWSLGGAMDFMIGGTIEQSWMAVNDSFDINPTVSFAGLLDYSVSPQVSIGFAPRAIIGVRRDNNSFKSAKQVDSRIRVAVGSQVSARVRLYGFVAPGYSVIFLPREPDGRKFHPHGLIAGFGGGLAYAMSARLAVTIELGYQLGYQGTLAYGMDVTYQDSFLHVGVGLVTPLR